MPLSLREEVPPDKTITFFFSGKEGPLTTDADLRRSIPRAFDGSFFKVESVRVNLIAAAVPNSITGHFVSFGSGYTNPAGVNYTVGQAMAIIQDRLESVDGFYLATIDGAEWGTGASSWIAFFAEQLGVSPWWIYLILGLAALFIVSLFISDIERLYGR